ncbi:small subunit rRNA processing protein, putative [Plasmodium ovale]|nr:small subunit rRNA processing protein, putative [Plasmodium ovale]
MMESDECIPVKKANRGDGEKLIEDETKLFVLTEGRNITDERFQFNDSLWEKVKKDESKRGIVYLSNIPIGLNVSKIREIFSKYGPIDKIHLNKAKDEEMNIIVRKKKKKKGKYEDGYVEFVSKKDAIRIEKLLNNQMIGGKKRKNILRENFWHIKYLKSFTWNDLISSVLYRNISRKDKIKHALKNMYKTYEDYLQRSREKETGTNKAEGENSLRGTPSELIKKNSRTEEMGTRKGAKKEAKKGTRMISSRRGDNIKLKFVTIKRGAKAPDVEDTKDTTEKKKNSNTNTISEDVLKLFL